MIYVDPKAEMTIVRYASHPAASNIVNDPVSLPAYRALAEWLTKNDTTNDIPIRESVAAFR